MVLPRAPSRSCGALRCALAVGALTVAVLSGLRVADAAAATQPTLVQVNGPASGGPGTALTYQYTWDYSDCASTGHPKMLHLILVWDDGATVIGTQNSLTVRKPDLCKGTVAGTVPNNATAGAHLPSAHLVDSVTTAPVPGSTAQASPGFIVVLPPTPTPARTPTPAPTPTSTPAASPTPTDTPLPTPTPTDVPSPSPSSTSDSSAVPITAGNTGSSAPPGAALLVAIVAVLVIAAATAAAVLFARRRRAGPGKGSSDDPFQFVR
jgi:hypothetical protein